MIPFNNFLKETKISTDKFTKIINKRGLNLSASSVAQYRRGVKYPSTETGYCLLKILHELGCTHFTILDLILPPKRVKELRIKYKNDPSERQAEVG